MLPSLCESDAGEELGLVVAIAVAVVGLLKPFFCGGVVVGGSDRRVDDEDEYIYCVCVMCMRVCQKCE